MGQAQAHHILSHQTKEQIMARMPEFTELNPWRSFIALVIDWMIIFSAIIVSIKLSDAWAYFLAILVIAGRQHALLVLMHEATHIRLSRNRWLNDLLGESTSFPHFITLDAFRENHLSHHRYNGTDKDPDWARLLPLEDWKFPKNGLQTVFLFVRYLYGYGLYEIGGLLKELPKRAEKKSGKPYARIGLYVAAFLLLAFTHQLPHFVSYWLVPFFIVLPAIMRVRGIAEHYGLPMAHELNNSRNVTCGWLERFFLAPHSVGLHLDHHLYAAVPFYNLPKLHKFLSQFDEYRQNAHENHSYVLPSRHSMLSDLLRRRVPTEGGA